MSKQSYPAFWQYTTTDALSKLIPPGLSSEMVVVKELLDNACDAAEKNGGDVTISLSDKKFSISNRGTITPDDMDVITDFSQRITEKYQKKAYIRGQIGHGIKIAIMLGISEHKPVIIKNSGYAFEILLIDRHAQDSKSVLDVKKHKELSDDNNVCINIVLDDINGIDDYIERYIALNPHITFRFNNTSYEKVSDVNKTKKIDIFSYSLEEFETTFKFYSTRGTSAENIISMFNVKRSEIKYISKKSLKDMYSLVMENSKPLKPPVFGKESIRHRLKQFWGSISGYKKIQIGRELFEIAVLDNCNNNNIVGVNGSCLSDKAVWITKEGSKDSTTLTLLHALTDMKAKRGVYLSYFSTAPLFKDTNKQTVVIENTKLFDVIKRLVKHKETTSWLLKKDVYKEQAYENDIKTSIVANGFKIKPYIYLFLMECKGITEAMYERYGPITLRQLYYQLVSKGIIKNSMNSYKYLSRYMGTARESEIIDYDLFEDRTRYVLYPDTISVSIKPKDYLQKKIQQVIIEPEINLWGWQKYYVELWFEKDAMVSLFSNIGKERQIAVFPSRGYTSHTKINEAKERFRQKTESDGKHGVILYAGDLDPSGWNIYEKIKEKLANENLHVIRFALNDEQVKNLIPIPVKLTDTRWETFCREHPELDKNCYELDAMDPDQLNDLTHKTIDKYFDTSLVDRNSINKWKEEFAIAKNDIFFKIRQV